MAIIHHHHHLLTVLYSFSCLSKTLGILTCRMIFLFGDEEQVGEKRRAKHTGWDGMGYTVRTGRLGEESNEGWAEGIRPSSWHKEANKRYKETCTQDILQMGGSHNKQIALRHPVVPFKLQSRSSWTQQNLAPFVQSLFCVLTKGRDHFHKQG